MCVWVDIHITPRDSSLWLVYDRRIPIFFMIRGAFRIVIRKQLVNRAIVGFVEKIAVKKLFRIQHIRFRPNTSADDRIITRRQHRLKQRDDIATITICLSETNQTINKSLRATEGLCNQCGQQLRTQVEVLL